VAGRATDVLEQKRTALQQRQRELAPQVEGARAAWESAAREAAGWLERARVLSGERSLRLAAFHAGGPASVRVRWQNALGVVHPVEARVELPMPIDVAALGGSSTVAVAVDAHRRALEAAARYAVIRTARNDGSPVTKPRWRRSS
jgi:vacuolar-type H+-ATPase subunit D/Vma8